MAKRKKVATAKKTRTTLIKVPASLTFQAPEFEYYKKNRWWALTVFVVAFLIILNLYLVQKYFLIVIILAAWAVFLRLGVQKPKKIEINLNKDGIKLKGRFYPWSAFASFGLLDKKTAGRRLYLDFPGFFSVPLTIEIISTSQIKPTILVNFLRKRLAERFIKHASLTDAINRYLRF